MAQDTVARQAMGTPSSQCAYSAWRMNQAPARNTAPTTQKLSSTCTRMRRTMAAIGEPSAGRRLCSHSLYRCSVRRQLAGAARSSRLAVPSALLIR